MELTQLKQFLAVARTENMSRAAENLYVSQPTLSGSISRLEQELGMKLFDRKNNRIILNNAGRRFANYVGSALESIDRGVTEAHMITARENIPINCASSIHVISKELIGDFFSDTQGVRLNYYFASVDEIRLGLQDETLDVGITLAPVEDDNLMWTKLNSSRVMAMMDDSNPLCKEQELHLHSMCDELFVTTRISKDWEDLSIGMCRKSGFEPRIIFSGDDSEIINYLILKKKAILMLPEIMVRIMPVPAGRGKNGETLRTILIEDEWCKFDYGIAMRRDKTYSEVTQSFIRYITARLSGR